MKLAANLSMLFTEVDFLDRFGAAARAGFPAVEYLFPYDYDAAVLKRKLTENGLTQALFNLPAGDWAGGERGIACQPDRAREFEAGVAKAIAYAQTLGCERVNCLVGLRPPHVDAGTARDVFVKNLRYAAPRMADAGIKLLIEPVNTRDIPGFFLTRTDQALEIIDAVDSPNLYLQYDVYHAQIMEGDLAPTLERNLRLLQHVQVADNPGRHEPGTGEINYGFLLPFLDRLGYQGWVAAEYKPAGRTEEGLGWAWDYLKPSTR